MDWVARAVGAFYLLGGLFALRAARMNDLMDKALSAIDLKPTPWTERLRSAGLWAGAAFSIAGGVALLLLSRWAAWIFAASLALQVAYLVAASIWLEPEDEADARGRRSTVNAAILWGLITLATIWWARTGLLR